MFMFVETVFQNKKERRFDQLFLNHFEPANVSYFTVPDLNHASIACWLAST